MTDKPVPETRVFTITLNLDSQSLAHLRKTLMGSGCRYSSFCNVNYNEACRNYKLMEDRADDIMNQIESQLTNIHGVDWIE
jgi:hypothetical protein